MGVEDCDKRANWRYSSGTGQLTIVAEGESQIECCSYLTSRALGNTN